MKARISQLNLTEEAFDRIVALCGGTRFEEAVEIPKGVKNCDYILNHMLIELKFIEKEFFESEYRQEKLNALLAYKCQRCRMEVL